MAPVLPLVLAAALAAAPAPPRPETSAPHGPLPDALIRARVGTHLDRLAALGYTGAVLVLRNGRPVVERAWGYADRDKGIRADTRSTWNLGSVTKQFTAAAILKLEERGKLRTTDSITRWFPEAQGAKRTITIHQLLTHTAGFESDYAPGDYVPNTRAEYMARMLAAPLQSPPGTEHSYANSGYSMLAAIIEMVTGKEYEAALTDLVLAPAGMTETGYLRPNWAPGRITHGYQDGRDWGTIVDRLKVPGAPFWALRGNGGLQTTLADMTRWERALTSNTVLAASSRRKFMTGHVSEGGQGDSRYAYGWAVHPSERGTRVVEHNGGNGIYVAEFRRLVDEGITIFVTSSVAELTATPVVDAVEELVFGGAVELPPAVAAVDGKELAAFAGRWRTEGGEPLDVEARDGRLLVRAGGPSSWLLLTLGDTAQSPRESELAAKALAIWQAASRGDAKPLFEALGGREPLDQLTEQVKGLAADRAERLGALKEVSLLGSVRRNGGIVVSTVRLDFERAVVSNVLVWGPDGTLSDRIARPLAPAVFVPVGPGAFQRFDLRGGPPDPAVRLERDGETGRIALVAPGGRRVVFTKPSP
ncbi:MAG: beta-lactamase family protein [Holophagales bacterium]|nr:beta-lactamase family protein [Holophagales bacterium]